MLDSEMAFAPAVLFLSTDAAPDTTATIGGEPIKIHVQREAGHRLAIQRGLGVVKEFVELRAATTSLRARPVLRRMLAYLERHPEVRWAIVPGGLPHDMAGLKRVQQQLERLKIAAVVQPPPVTSTPHRSVTKKVATQRT
ncbi:recombinase family protein [Nocardia farcinica]|uniref:recombinase family protein n=1 Tax=Nocardia farcinica TaxID=37329 RepID=UPI001894DC96|nr:recombinase family protein [Nocardia farcinica]MBF6258801.1 recombinase family protein [Nocardia farcinica]